MSFCCIGFPFVSPHLPLQHSSGFVVFSVDVPDTQKELPDTVFHANPFPMLIKIPSLHIEVITRIWVLLASWLKFRVLS